MWLFLVEGYYQIIQQIQKLHHLPPQLWQHSVLMEWFMVWWCARTKDASSSFIRQEKELLPQILPRQWPEQNLLPASSVQASTQLDELQQIVDGLHRDPTSLIPGVIPGVQSSPPRMPTMPFKAQLKPPLFLAGYGNQVFWASKNSLFGSYSKIGSAQEISWEERICF